MTSVLVRLPIGSVQCSRATADVFERDVLTVTSRDTGNDLRVFEPDRWIDATVYEGDDVSHVLVNSQSARAVARVAADLNVIAESLRHGRVA